MESKIKLIFSGDFAPPLDSKDIDRNHFEELQLLLSDVNCHITNLECPLTNYTHSIEKTGPSLRSVSEKIELLQQANVSISCLANNHIYDFGEKGITDTLNTCQENGIDTLGVVNRPDGRNHWLIKEIKGKRFGFLNYCEHEFSVREPSLLGACGFSPIDAYYDICKLKPRVDYLIVIYHGGNEYYPLPNPEMKKNFYYLADLGADAVIGHHTHVYSGYEVYNGKPLVYSLGNFFFPYPGEPEEWHYGLLCELNVGSEITIDLHPIVQCKDKLETKPAEYPVKQKILNDISELSEVIRNDEKLIKYWENYCEDKRMGYLKQFPCFSLPLRVAVKLGVSMRYILPEKRLRGYENLLRCQAHYEILKYAMKKGNS
jgi:hypothetical protein